VIERRRECEIVACDAGVLVQDKRTVRVVETPAQGSSFTPILSP
jgi:hypothetical protein